MSSLPEETPPAGKGSFSLTFSDTTRTILPVAPSLNDFAVYNLDFTPTNGGSAENTNRTNATLVTDPVYLEPGTYKLVVNAYKDNNKTQLAAQGKLDNVAITAGKNTSAAVTLKAILLDGMGTFKWDIILPDGVTANMTIMPGNENGTSQETVTLTPPQASGSRALNSGPYNITFNLEKADGKSAVWKELLYVYQNLESVFSFEFTDAHLIESIYVITFDSNGGEPGEWQQSILHGDKIITPVAPTRRGYALIGWYTDNDTFANTWNFNNSVIEPFTLYAKWESTVVPGATLAAKLSWVQTNSVSGRNYILEVDADESIEPHSLSYSGRSNISITLIGIDANRTISLSSDGAMFMVGSSVTLILDNNITLEGHSSNTNSLIRVYGGTLIMNDGSTITGNTNTSTSSVLRGGGVYVVGTFTMNGGKISDNTSSSSGGGGVYVGQYGTSFTMSGGEISGNSASSSSGGGGVYVDSNGTFTMSGGEISGNTSGVSVRDNGTFTMSGGEISGNTSGVSVIYGTFTMEGGEISGNTGSGVYIYGRTFTMSGGKISGNTSPSGGGVSVRDNGTFTMSGGEISGNTSPSGGGVSVRDNGTFTMSGGEISGNSASSSSGGGGVYVDSNGTFTMEGGKISDNTSSSSGGGGVYVGYNGTFTMSGGEISGNSASSYGGGVYVGSGIFTKTNGTIYGYSESDTVNSNVVKDGSGTVINDCGHAVYVAISPIKRRETTAGTSVNMDSTIPGTAGGWENPYKEYAPGSSLAAKLDWLQVNAVNDGDYIFEIDTDESIDPQTLSYSGKSNITITLIGIDSNRTINLSSNGAIFTVSRSVTLILDNNITLHGRSSNSSSLVQVYYGTLIMNAGAKISGNTSPSSGGGGVYVGGTFTMEGGEISGNSASYGGGVYVGGTFTMRGGTISDNTASNPNPNSNSGGGGVFVNNVGGTFTMEGGKISGNTAASSGGGVYVTNNGRFRMRGGTISDNTTSNSSGGGVSVGGATFTMEGGEISGNTASSGGGVSVGGSFTMEGGEISGNSASSSGGGVSVGTGTFTKTGGTIIGYASDTVNSNVVKNNSGTIVNNQGHAVYAAYYSTTSVTKRKETTAGPVVNLSWDYNNASVTFSGGWDY